MTKPAPTRGTESVIAQGADRISTKLLPEHNRMHNRALVLQTLFRQGAMSRADLARWCGLTRTTISVLIAELTADGLVAELGTRDDVRVGKPATLLGVLADAHSIVSLDLSSADRFTGAVVNLAGEIVHHAELPVGDRSGDEAVELALQLGDELLAAAPQRVLGIGIGTPGIVAPGGIVREGLHLDWTELPLAARFTARFALPAYVSNDANAAALGVRTFDEMTGNSVLVVNLEHGVGLGLIIGGALVAGEQFSAGEIGHVTVDELGDRCACGRRGCLETVIGTNHLRQRLAEAPHDAGAGDEILEEAGSALGRVLAPIVSALNLNDIVITGPNDLLEGAFTYATLRALRARTLPTVNHKIHIRIADSERPLILLGAAALVLSAELGVS